jgi:hypothetical protein
MVFSATKPNPFVAPTPTQATPIESVSPQISLGLVTCVGGCVQKAINLVDGAAVKDPAHELTVWSGFYEDKIVDSLAGLADLLGNLGPKQALTLGVCNRGSQQTLITAKKWEEIGSPAEKIMARTQRCIEWSDVAHLLLIDVDLEPGAQPLTVAELLALLISVVPAIEGIGYLVTESTSSQIYNSETGECLRGSGNFHLYIVVRGDVARFSEHLKTLFWASGKGFFKLATANSKTGVSAILERFPIDMSVFSPERFVYEAGAKLGPGLEQRRAAPIVVEGGVLDLDAVVVTDEQRLVAEHNKKVAHRAIKKTREDAVSEFIVKSTDHNAASARIIAKDRIKNCDKGVLQPDHVIHLQDGTEVLAGDLNESHNGLSCRDPQEPDYDGGRFCARIYWNKKGVTISSFAHGKCRYTVLSKQAETGDDNAPGTRERADKSPKPDEKQFELKDAALCDEVISSWEGDIKFNAEIQSWVRYNSSEGVWQVVSSDRIESIVKLIADTQAEDYKATLISGTVKLARIDDEILMDSMVSATDVLLFKNGVLNLKTNTLSAHSRDNHAMWKLRRDYDPEQTQWVPIAEFITKALRSKSDQDRLVAFHAATLRNLFVKLPGKNKKNTLLQVGGSGAGKGTSTRLMIELVGLTNTKSIGSIQSLCSGEFALDGIEEENPLLLVIADQEKLPPRMAIGRFLQLTGLDYVDVGRKHKRAARYQHRGGTVISSTDYPYSAFHRSRGTTRRSVLIQSWRDDAMLSGIEDKFTDSVISGYTNFLLSLPEQWILTTLEAAPGEPTIENDSLDNPMMAWFMDCIRITGEGRDRLQVGRDKTRVDQLFGSYFAYCDAANIGPAYSKNHVTFAREFEQIYNRLAATMADSGREFGIVRPENKLHYMGIALKHEADDSSRCGHDDAQTDDAEVLTSPCQIGLVAQLPAVESDLVEEIVTEVDPIVPDIDSLPQIDPPEDSPEWVPAIGDHVAVLGSAGWVAATIETIPTDHRDPSKRCNFYKIGLPSGGLTHVWDRNKLRLLTTQLNMVAA